MGMVLRRLVEVEADRMDLEGFIVNDTDEDDERNDDEADGKDSEVKQSNDHTTLLTLKGATGRLNASKMPCQQTKTGALVGNCIPAVLNAGCD